MSDRRKLTAADRRARDRLILEERSRGTPWAHIAQRFKLSERQARRAAASASRLAVEQGLGDIDAAKLVEDIVRAQARALYRLEELVLTSDGPVAVGACRALGTLGSELRESLRAVGLLPPVEEKWMREQLGLGVQAVSAAAEELGIPLAAVTAKHAEAEVLTSRGLVTSNGGGSR